MSNDDLRKQHELLLGKWRHEDELINHKLTWLAVSSDQIPPFASTPYLLPGDICRRIYGDRLAIV